VWCRGPGDPQAFNRYAYARNSPVGRVDPSGHGDFNVHQVDSLPDDGAVGGVSEQAVVNYYVRQYRRYGRDTAIANVHVSRLQNAATSARIQGQYEKASQGLGTVPSGPQKPAQRDEVMQYLGSKEWDSRKSKPHRQPDYTTVSFGISTQWGSSLQGSISFDRYGNTYIAGGKGAGVNYPARFTFNIMQGYIGGNTANFASEQEAAGFLTQHSTGSTACGILICAGSVTSTSSGVVSSEEGLGTPQIGVSEMYTGLVVKADESIHLIPP